MNKIIISVIMLLLLAGGSYSASAQKKLKTERPDLEQIRKATLDMSATTQL